MEISEDFPVRLRLADENGVKPTLSDFDSNEKFYRSFELTMLRPGSEKFPACALKFPACSCNWSRFAEPEDSWRYFPGQGVASLVIGECPQTWPEPFSMRWEWVHSPEQAMNQKPENYSHCEILAYSGSGELLDKNLGLDEVTRKQYRSMMARIVKVEKSTAKPQ